MVKRKRGKETLDRIGEKVDRKESQFAGWGAPSSSDPKREGQEEESANLQRPPGGELQGV